MFGHDGLHQGSALSQFIFVLMMDELTGHIQGEMIWCVLFANDIVSNDKMCGGENDRLKDWRYIDHTV